MQVILAGSFAFDILDRISGGTLNIVVPDWINSSLVDYVIKVPFLWFVLNMIWLAVISRLLIWLMNFLGDMANGEYTLRVKVNLKIDTKRLHAYLDTKTLEVTDSVAEALVEIRKCQWQVRWRGENVRQVVEKAMPTVARASQSIAEGRKVASLL